MKNICTAITLGLLTAGCTSRAAPPQPDTAPGKPATPGHATHTLTSGGHERTYGVYVPTSYTGKTPLPLVVVLHGGGGSSHSTLRDSNWQQKAEAETFLLVTPNGLARDPTQPAKFRGNPQTWNDGSGRFTHGDKAELIDDVAFLDAMLDEIIGKLAVDEKRVYVTGFSNGAAMTFRFGERSKRRIAAIAPVAGACWSERPRLAHPIPLCYITGDKDLLNPMNGGTITLPGGTAALNATPKPSVSECVARWSRALGEDTALEPRETLSHGVRVTTNRKSVTLVTIPGLGHYWPGGARNLPEAIAGPYVNVFDATGFIWDFFARHPVR